ncbi:unnamed protein product [Rhizophagus irregularis]|nr:unnamed protein product [Rhizophagus irregularis]
MDQRQAPEFTISRKNSASTAGTSKRPKVTKSYSTPINATGRGGKRGGASAASTPKTGRGGVGSRGGSTRGSSARGRGRGSGTGTGVSGGRKLSLQRDSFTGTATTPASSTSPSTPRDAYFSIPPTPASELDQYILHDNDLIEGGIKVNDNNKEGEEEEDADEELGGTANTEWSQTRSKEELKMLLDNFSEEQLKRYEVYRRSALSKPNVKRMVGQILGHPCSHNMSIVVAGFAKVFVGEIVEKALDVRQEWGETGSLSPEHLREAYRRYKKETKLTHNYQKRLFTK